MTTKKQQTVLSHLLTEGETRVKGLQTNYGSGVLTCIAALKRKGLVKAGVQLKGKGNLPGDDKGSVTLTSKGKSTARPK
jgi:hypothetical protein